MHAMSSRLKEINDEIFARWKAGENHIDLAKEYGRFGLYTLIQRRALAERYANEPKHPSNWEAHKANAKRDAQIVRRRAAGWSWSKIAAEAGVCRERCRQIYNRHLRRTAHPFGRGKSHSSR